MCLNCLGFYCTTGLRLRFALAFSFCVCSFRDLASALVKAPFSLLRCRGPFASSRNGAIKNLREINKYS